MTADLPAGIDLSRHRDLEGRGFGQWLKRGFVVLLALFILAGLLNFFGQSSTTSTARSARASLTVMAPPRVRGGLVYQATFQIHAISAIGNPVLVLDRGWFDQTTVNTLEPQPLGETSDANQVKLRFAPLRAGRTLLVHLDLQANPTNLGSHATGVALKDGPRRLVSVDRSQFDFP
ncbi:MAG: hypothetical protein H0X42_08735 [Solirubrobacterales bacterium]|nr:hypothetical protein [Solirubrobacterales bacterium]